MLCAVSIVSADVSFTFGKLLSVLADNVLPVVFFFSALSHSSRYALFSREIPYVLSYAPVCRKMFSERLLNALRLMLFQPEFHA